MSSSRVPSGSSATTPRLPAGKTTAVSSSDSSARRLDASTCAIEVAGAERQVGQAEAVHLPTAPVADVARLAVPQQLDPETVALEVHRFEARGRGARAAGGSRRRRSRGVRPRRSPGRRSRTGASVRARSRRGPRASRGRRAPAFQQPPRASGRSVPTRRPEFSSRRAIHAASRNATVPQGRCAAPQGRGAR